MHVHPRATWRVDFQKQIVKKLQENMSLDEIDRAMKATDGKEKIELFVTLNFHKQYIQSEDGIIRGTIKIQTAPKIKEIMNNTLFKASKNEQGDTTPTEVEEYGKILKCQNAFLATSLGDAKVAVGRK